MNRAETIQAILTIAREVFEREVTDGDDFFSIGGDSLKAVEFSVRLEELLNMELDQRSLWDAETLHEFAAQLADKVSQLPGRSSPAVEPASARQNSSAARSTSPT